MLTGPASLKRVGTPRALALNGAAVRRTPGGGASLRSNFLLSAATETLAVRGFSGPPEVKFSGAMSPKYVGNSSGVLAQQARLFRTQTRTRSIALPDAQGGVPGNGFTCTGIAPWIDGLSVWMGNDGTTQDNLAFSRRPSLVHVRLSDGAKLAEIDVGTILQNSASPQGIAVDTTNNSLWAAIAIIPGIYNLTTTGTVLSSFTWAGANGLAYDSMRDCLYAMAVADGIIHKISKAGSSIASFQGPTNGPDHLWYDPDRDYIWASYGQNGEIGAARAYRASDFSLVGTVVFTDATAIEGICILDGKFLIAHDGYFHGPSGAVRQINEIQEYPAVHGPFDAAWAVEYEALTPFAKRGYLFEPAFTRLSDFPTKLSSWAAPTNGTITDNVATSPDGTTSADELKANAGTFAVYTSETYTAATGAAAQAIYAEKGTWDYAWIGDRGAAGIPCATFNLNTGAVVGSSGGAEPSIRVMRDGRCKIAIEYSRGTSGSSGLTLCLGKSTHATDRPSAAWAGTETIRVWGGQGANAPWIGSPVISNDAGGEVRIADVATIPLTAWDFGATENTFIVEAWTAERNGGVNHVLLSADGASEDERFRCVWDSSGVLRWIVTVGGVEVCNLSMATIAPGTHFKSAFRAVANDFAASLNGGAVVTDASGALPTVTTLRLGSSFTGEQWGGAITMVSIEGTGLTNSALIAATA